MIDAILFYWFAFLALLGAVLTVTRKSAVHSAISLIVALVGVAGLFLLQQAEFLFATQIVLYIGGIMVLFLFVIMLVNLDEMTRVRQYNRQWMLALISVALVAVQIGVFLLKGAKSFRLASPEAAAPVKDGNVERLADLLFSQYLLPFEIASILLLVAVVGSVMMAKKKV